MAFTFTLALPSMHGLASQRTNARLEGPSASPPLEQALLLLPTQVTGPILPPTALASTHPGTLHILVSALVPDLTYLVPLLLDFTQ